MFNQNDKKVFQPFLSSNTFFEKSNVSIGKFGFVCNAVANEFTKSLQKFY